MTGIEERHLQALRALADHQVQFVLIGGVALQAYGYTAATQDVDVAVAVGASNEQRVDAALRTLGAHSPAPGTRGTTFQTRVGKVELLRDTDGIGPYDAWMRGARPMRLAEGLSVAVGSPSDVLLSKEAAGRDKDTDALPQIRAELLELGVLHRAELRGPVAEQASPASRQQQMAEASARAMLGPRPQEDKLAAVWDYTARRIAEHRDLWQITSGPDGPLGPAAAGAEQTADRRRVEASVQRTLRLLGRGCAEPDLGPQR